LAAVAVRRTVQTCQVTSRRAAVVLALVAASLTASRAAHAEVDLKWDAPPGCPERDDVLNRIGALVGSSLDKTEGLAVEGTIERTNGRYSLELLVRDGREVRTRVIASESCADLAGAAAVTLALLLGIEVHSAEPPADGGTSTPTTSNDPSTKARDGGSQKRDERAARGDAATEKPTPPEAPEASSQGWNLLLRVPAFSADFGPMPKPTLGVGLGVGVRHASWRFLLDGRISRGQTVSAPELGDGVGAELERLTGEVMACRGWRLPPFELGPCVGLAVEHVSARGTGAGVSPELQRATWPALRAGAVTHWYALDSLAFFASVTGYVELSRPRLVIEGLGEIGQFPTLAAGFLLGAEWIL
jgi:hypothetical protein